MAKNVQGSGKNQRDPVFNRVKWCRFADRHFQHYPNCGRIKYRRWELYHLIDWACESFQQQETLIEVFPPLNVVGDIHGQFDDLLRIISTLGRPPTSRYLFLGDYVDRGNYSLECLALLLTYKILYPHNVYLLRGNHECTRINKVYGFMDELKRRFSDKGLWLSFQRVFDLMPITALISDKILCMHGGLSPELNSLEQLRQLKRPLVDPRTGIANDILWSDPEVGLTGWSPSPRKTSHVFGSDVLDRMCNRLDIELVARAHQVCQDGYRFFGNKKLVTIFSASRYCNEHENQCAVMKVDGALVCSFVIFQHQKDATRRRTTWRKT